MQISRLLFERMVALFGNPSNALLPTAALSNIRIQPVNVPFTPSLDRVLADVPVQTTDVNTPIEVYPDRPATFYTDVLSGERVVEFELLNTPGAFIKASNGTPFTIFGTRLVSFDGLTLLATETLPVSVPLAKTTEAVRSPRIEFRFPPDMVR